MDDIRRIRPQSKRKAVRAEFFYSRYLSEYMTARERGDTDEAVKLLEKSRYWQARYERLARRNA